MRVVSLLAYVGFIVVEVFKGSWRVLHDTLSPRVVSTPSIVELPLRCHSDLEVTALASSITITPGTLVVGTAAGTPTTPPVLYVHSLYGRDRAEVIDGLRDMERRLLKVTRGRDAGGGSAT